MAMSWGEGEVGETEAREENPGLQNLLQYNHHVVTISGYFVCAAYIYTDYYYYCIFHI